ncbi:hypothetical protein GSS88_09295 [Corynebacterium sp. 3HC-13]|uniref:hypothetical protein n=1 Tax=Corynebacterium poyangense TaxID=2684405 RepID=UPI001CCF0C63|nr:hypothetical protein [Corynebacterium poyangense]MBZ8177978.1 hypothetical protein [Corynebacterium poyangense]
MSPPQDYTSPTTVVINRVLMANLEIQETTGHTEQCTTVEAFLAALHPSPEHHNYFFADVHPDPDSPINFSQLPQGEFGLPLIPATGPESDNLLTADYHAFLLCGASVQAYPDQLSASLVVDANYLPAPTTLAEDVPDATYDLVHSMIDLAETIARNLGRSQVTSWCYLGNGDNPFANFWSRAWSDHGYIVAHREDQYLVEMSENSSELVSPADLAGIKVHCYDEAGCPDYLLPALCQLLDIAERDIPTGDLGLSDTAWTSDRVRSEEKSARDGNYRSINVLLTNEQNQPVALSQISQHHSDMPEVASQVLTVVMPEWRRNGIGTAVKRIAWHQVRELWPQVRSIGTSMAPDNSGMLAINNGLGMTRVSRSCCWMKDLKAVS